MNQQVGRKPVSYRRDIDGLRCIAVLAVVLFHAKLPLVAGGYVGVDVFFVISGYLITAILLEDVSIVRFYQRRARRILPALLSVIGLTLLAGVLILLPHDLAELARSAAATLLFFSNVWFWRQAGYFATQTELWPLLHTWSLGVEEQFYLFFPLVVLLTRRFSRRVNAGIFLMLAAISLGSAVFAMSHLKPVMAFYLLPMRAWELLAGSILATRVIPSPAGAMQRTGVAAIGVATILWTIVAYTPGTAFPGLGAIPPVLGSVLIIWAGQDRPHHLTAVLGAAPLRFVGLISYSLYLWHWPVLAIARYVSVGPLTALETTGVVVVTFGLATLSWHFVERPFRAGFSSRQIWLFSASGIAAALAGCAVLIAGDGFPRRFPAAVGALNANQGVTWRCPVTTMVPFGGFYACPLNAGSSAVRDARVILWGDSHAQMYAPALMDALAGRPGLLINANGCAPVSGEAADPTCGAIQRGNYRMILAHPADTVIIAQNWPQYRDEAGVRLGRNPRPDERYQDGIRRLREVVAGLRSGGKTVVIVAPVPLPGYDLASVAARDLAFHGAIRSPTGIARSVYLAEYANVLAAMDALERTGQARVIRPASIACHADRCAFVSDGRAMFADHGHYAISFARRFAPLFSRALAGPGQPRSNGLSYRNGADSVRSDQQTKG